MSLTFKRATRTSVPLKLGISGPSGSGKTTAALRVARGLVGPAGQIALVDTENGSASLYADITEFDTLRMNPPYQVMKFLAALEAAVQGGYQALVIDSASHEWTELLTEKEAMDARGGNTYANWAPITKKHEEFLAAIRNAPIHVICCLRAKEKHEINEKKQVIKLGQGSQMRDGFEFELTVAWDLGMDHNAKTSKDRTRLFDGRLEHLTEATGRELGTWLESGGVLVPEEAPVEQAPASTPEVGTPAYQKAFGAMTEEIQAEKLAAKPEPSQAASDFVDGMADGNWLSPEGCVDITDAAVKGKVDLKQLAAYLNKKGWMPDVQNWTRIHKDALEPMRIHLGAERLQAFKAHLKSHFPGQKAA